MDEINPTQKILRKNSVRAEVSRKNRSRNDSAEVRSDSSPVDRVTLSTTSIEASRTKPATSEIRQDVVNKFKRKLESNDYSVKANEIAEKIVQNIRDNKSQHLIF